MDRKNLYKNWEKFKIVKCHNNSKIPAEKDWLENARSGKDIEELIKQGYNVGLALQPSGLVAIDLDYHSPDSNPEGELQELEKQLGKLPRTLTQQTATGKGKHLIFSADGVITPKGLLGKNIDLKYKGQIMIAPSIINGKQYQIIDGVDSNGDFIISKLPKEWTEFINLKYSSPEHKEGTKKTYENVDTDYLLNHCNFLKYCKKNASGLSEPEWFSMVGVLACMPDSDDFIHELSEPYAGYDYNETQQKIDRARENGLCRTCQYLAENHNVCGDCPQLKKEYSNPYSLIFKRKKKMYKSKIRYSNSLINSPFYYDKPDFTASEKNQKDLTASAKSWHEYLKAPENGSLRENLKEKLGFDESIIKKMGIGYDKRHNCYSFPQRAYSIDPESKFLLSAEMRGKDLSADGAYPLKMLSQGLCQVNKFEKTMDSVVITDNVINGISLFIFFMKKNLSKKYHIVYPSDYFELESQLKQLLWHNYTGFLLALNNSVDTPKLLEKLQGTYTHNGKTIFTDFRVKCKNCPRKCGKEELTPCYDFNEFYRKAIL